MPVEVVTDKAAAYPIVLDEVLPAVWHRTERYANNHIECDHGRLKAWLRPMRGLKQDRTARGTVASGDHRRRRPPQSPETRPSTFGIDRFGRLLQPSGREAPPLCYSPAMPFGQMQQCAPKVVWEIVEGQPAQRVEIEHSWGGVNRWRPRSRRSSRPLAAVRGLPT
jgi:hypothetical protein